MIKYSDCFVQALYRAIAALLLLSLAGCGTKNEVETVLDRQAEVSFKVPDQYQPEVALNPNNEFSTTWIRSDGLGLLALDRQPISGEKHRVLQVQGYKRYLIRSAAEFRRDLESGLEEFSDFHQETTFINDSEAVLMSFRTRHQGLEYLDQVLLLLELGNPPHEIMLDYRIPFSEAEGDQGLHEVMESWNTKSEGDKVPSEAVQEEKKEH